MNGDRPITRLDEDRLGFGPIAEQLAKAIVDLPAEEGFVFGIEGKWGSGKSTLVNLTIDALGKLQVRRPEIVSFAPWIVGSRDGLLRSLFNELSSAAVKIDPTEQAISASAADDASIAGTLRRNFNNAHWRLQQKQKLKQLLAGKLKTFGYLAGSVGRAARVADAAGLPGSGIVAETAERTSDAASRFLEVSSVTKKKAELVSALKLLSRPIAIFIDDLDRLEPRDVSEVLRLVRAVADFPNVVYVLSYDPDVVAKTVEKAIQVEDGAAFLEKMVQVSFRVPRPEAFDLRRWFQLEVFKLFVSELEALGEGRKSVEQRLLQVIDTLGGRYLETGRDVIRALNALQLHGPRFRKLVDIPDMVWLQLVRIGNPDLYDWTEKYLTEVAAVAAGASVTGEASKSMLKHLETILATEGTDVDHSMFELSEVLPGIDSSLVGTAEKRRLFKNIRGDSMNDLVSSKRLGSPDHYRYYFAFSHPAGSIPDAQVQAFIQLSEARPHEAVQMFAKLAGELRPQGGAKADVLIDRVVSWSNRIPELAVPGMFGAFANTLDEVALNTPAGDFDEHTGWRGATRAVKALLKQTTGDVRALSIRALFDEGSAIGWLTNVLRSEIFSHGHYGDHREPETNWILTADEFNRVLTVMVDRYRNTLPAELMRKPDFLSLLYAWKQATGTNEVNDWVQAQIATDAGLLSFLKAMRSWSASSTFAVQYPLRRHHLIPFLDFDAAIARVRAISTNSEVTEEDRRTAIEVLKAADMGNKLDH
jgi:predicted KAP-like P-loop ATPase